jgi:hypothetical protein
MAEPGTGRGKFIGRVFVPSALNRAYVLQGTKNQSRAGAKNKSIRLQRHTPGSAMLQRLLDDPTVENR